MNQAQDLFFSFPEVRVVEASAGSGKTYALAKRYVQLLLHAQSPSWDSAIEQILALTFTNKAAIEMKGRILDVLKALALDQLPEAVYDDVAGPLELERREVQRRAFVLMDDIIRHYNFFQVQTIDKFINAILSGCAFKIGLTAHFKIMTTSDEYLQRALDQ